MRIIDLHCDTIYRIFHEKEKNLYENFYSVDIQKLKKGNVAAQFFALFIDKDWVSKKGMDIYTHAHDLYEVFQTQIAANSHHIKLTRNLEELRNNCQKNKISAFLTIEEGDFLQGRMERLDAFYALGLRLVTLTWNYENCIGYPNSTDRQIMKRGLKPFGFEVIERMNQLGMIIDVSHLSDGGFYDCIAHSKKPIIASHSNARALIHHPRNLTDDMLKKLAHKGGVVGINFCPAFLGRDQVSRIEYIIQHIQHIKNKAGIDSISLGTDFDGIDGPLEIDNIGNIYQLVDELEKSGFHPDEIEKYPIKM